MFFVHTFQQGELFMDSKIGKDYLGDWFMRNLMDITSYLRLKTGMGRQTQLP